MLSGGGARAAYQVGCLRHIAKVMPTYRPRILTGVSAGAINAIHLAAHRGNWWDAVQDLSDLWLSLRTQKVYRTDLTHVLYRVAHWGLKVASSGRLGRKDIRGMVDASPLRDFLNDHVPNNAGRVTGIEDNLQDGLLDALAIITTSYAQSRSVAWVEAAAGIQIERGQLYPRAAQLNIDHVLASAALPLFFPAIQLDGTWHGDGGVRLTAPLSPALHLGATRILAVSPRARVPRIEEGAALSTNPSYPSPAKIAGVLLNAVFLDLLDFDALQMQRINSLLADSANTAKAAAKRYRQVDVMVVRPERDLGVIAREHEISLPRSFRYFERGLGNPNEPTADALSMVMFEPEYLGLLMDLGEKDAEARSEEIQAFLRGEPAPTAAP